MVSFLGLSFLFILLFSELVRGDVIRDDQSPSFSGAELDVRSDEENPAMRDRRNMGLVKRQACGAGVGSCPAGQCCSSGGQCGTGHSYCNGPSCQLAYGPACDGNNSPPGSSTANVPRPVLGSVPYGGSGIYHCTQPNVIALTFDDGPYNFTTSVLATLAKYNVTATFFINGNSLGKSRIDDPTTPWPQVLRSMHTAGHQLASHTWTHQDLTSLPQNLMANQIIYNEMAFRNIFGFFPTYIRPPFGFCAGSSNCSTYLNSMGYHIIIWDVDTKDYLNDDPTLILNSQKYFAGNTSNPANGHSYIPLAHDIHSNTASTLITYMLDTLLARGYKVVTVGECLGDPRPNWYRDGVTGGFVASSSTSSSTKTASTSIAPVKSTSTTSSKLQPATAVGVVTSSSHATTITGTSSATSSATSTPTTVLTPSTVPKSSANQLLVSSWSCYIFCVWSWAIYLYSLH